jgi:hypothetical protein
MLFFVFLSLVAMFDLLICCEKTVSRDPGCPSSSARARIVRLSQRLSSAPPHRRDARSLGRVALGQVRDSASMPVYLVTAVELEGGQREFEYRSDIALRRDSHLRNRPHEDAPLRAYVVKRVTRDPSHRYDGLIDANQWIASDS